jgi:hypothetical protein
MKMRLALILSFSLVGPSVADACLNAMRVGGDDAVKQIANAERLLAKGQLAKAERLVDQHEYEFSDSRLEKKAALVFHTAGLRRAKVSTWRIENATRFLTAALAKNSEDPLLIARHAEALALSDKTADKARAALEDLAERDLMPEAQSYTALARLLAKAGETAASKEAVASCLKMTKHKAVCSITPKSVKQRKKSRARSRGVLGDAAPRNQTLSGSSK